MAYTSLSPFFFPFFHVPATVADVAAAVSWSLRPPLPFMSCDLQLTGAAPPTSLALVLLIGGGGTEVVDVSVTPLQLTRGRGTKAAFDEPGFGALCRHVLLPACPPLSAPPPTPSHMTALPLGSKPHSKAETDEFVSNGINAGDECTGKLGKEGSTRGILL